MFFKERLTIAMLMSMMKNKMDGIEYYLHNIEKNTTDSSEEFLLKIEQIKNELILA